MKFRRRAMVVFFGSLAEFLLTKILLPYVGIVEELDSRWFLVMITSNIVMSQIADIVYKKYRS